MGFRVKGLRFRAEGLGLGGLEVFWFGSEPRAWSLPTNVPLKKRYGPDEKYIYLL